MKDENFERGIRQFAERAGGQIGETGDTFCTVLFPGEPYPVIIDVGPFGLSLNFSTYSAFLAETPVARDLLLNNWGSVEGTGFYCSVNVQDNLPRLLIETYQFVRPNATPEDIALLLLTCWRQCRIAKRSADSINDRQRQKTKRRGGFWLRCTKSKERINESRLG